MLGAAACLPQVAVLLALLPAASGSAAAATTSPAATAVRPPACYPDDEEMCCWPGACPGWGWRSHGGLPELPWAADWSVNGSIASYFVGNASGYNSERETAAGAELGVYGIGWELDNIPANYTDIEPAEIAAAAALKARNPSIKVGVTRNSVVGNRFWNTAKAVMDDPPSPYFWLQCGPPPNPCTNKWGLDEPCSKGGTGACDPTSYMFNFSDATLADWYVSTYLGEVANSSSFDVVYFDAGVNVSIAPGLQSKAGLERYIRDSQTVFDRGVALIKAKGKWPMSWTGFGNVPEQLPPSNTTGDACSVMAKWMAGVKAGHNFSPTTMAFSKCWRFPCPDTPPPTANAASAPGLEVAVGDHWPNGPPTPTDQNATVAAFMLAREASAVLQLHVHGAYAEAVDFHFPPILRTDYGPALGKATLEGTVYTRNFEGGSVSLDCAAWRSTFTPLESDGRA